MRGLGRRRRGEAVSAETDPEPKSQEIRLRGTVSTTAFGSLMLVTRKYLSVDHICTGAGLARQCAELETRVVSRELIRDENLPWWDFRYAAASVTACVSFLEANINELYNDACDKPHELTALSALETGNLAAQWSGYKQKNSWRLMDRFQDALVCAGRTKFDMGKKPCQPVKILTRLRHFLVHYQTESISTPQQRRKVARDIEQTLKGQHFEPNRFIAAGNPFLPDRCLGYGCAKWAVDSSLAFVDEFNDRMGLPANYERVREELALPILPKGRAQV